MTAISIVSLSPTPILFEAYGPDRTTIILSSLTTLAAACEIVLSPLLGSVLDSVGRKPALIASSLIVAAANAAASQNPAARPVATARFFSYIAIPQFFLASQAVAGDLFAAAPEKLGAFLGLQGGLISLGFLGGVLAAGKLSEWKGVKVVYGLSSVLALVAGAGITLGMGETLGKKERTPFDLARTRSKVLRAPASAGKLLVSRGPKVRVLAVLLILMSMPIFMGDVIQVYARKEWGLEPKELAPLIAVFGVTNIASMLAGSALLPRLGVQHFTGLAILSGVIFPLSATRSYEAALIGAVAGFMGSAQSLGVKATLTTKVTALGVKQGEFAGEKASLLAMVKIGCPLLYGSLYVLGSRAGVPQVLFLFNVLLAALAMALSQRDVW
jgi:MFS family permease